MRIAFFGWFGAFDYSRIGGDNSIVRRLSQQLVHLGFQVDYVMFGSTETVTKSIKPGWRLNYYRTYQDAARALSNRFDHVVTMYLFPFQRLHFGAYRLSASRRTKFHRLYNVWPENKLRRTFTHLDSLLLPFNGKLIAISPRIQRILRRHTKNVALLLPPVDEVYFVQPGSKRNRLNNDVRLTYIGRTESAKGIQDVVELFSRFTLQDGVLTSVLGYHWKSDSESVDWHRWFLEQNKIHYRFANYKLYNEDVDEIVRQTLRSTDILYLPYRRLSSAIDVPLLLLEAMASSCMVITRPLGDIPFLYGDANSLIPGKGDVDQAERIIQQVLRQQRLHDIQSRVHQRALELSFDSPSVAQRFVECILEA